MEVIRVKKGDEITARRTQSSISRCGKPLIFLINIVHVRPKQTSNLSGVVRRAIIHHNHLHFHLRTTLLQHAGNSVRKKTGVIIAGDYY